MSHWQQRFWCRFGLSSSIRNC